MGKVGYGGMDSLSRVSAEYRIPTAFQEQKSIDSDLLEEQKLFSVNSEVEGLLKSLMEKKQHEDETQ